MDETTTEETRVCPSCDEERPASAFRSAHPRTHCDDCHAAKGRATEVVESASPDVVARVAVLVESRAQAGIRNALTERYGEDRVEDLEIPTECPVFGTRMRDARLHCLGGELDVVVSRRAAEILGSASPGEIARVAAWLAEWS